MKTLILTIGVPGSGKSTWSKEFVKENPDYIRICPDEIREELTGNINDQSKNYLVWEIARKRVIENLKKYNVILDATNVNTKSRNKFIKGIEATIEYKIFNADKTECVKRIQKDIKNNVNRSNVPIEVINRMYEEYLYTVIFDLKKKDCDD